MKSNFRAAMKAGNMPWKKLTEELIKDNTVQNKAEVEYGLLAYLNSMSEFSIDPTGVKKLPNDKLEKKFESMRGEVAKLMGVVSPSCKRMILICK